MQIQSLYGLKSTFAFKGLPQRQTTVGQVISQITAPIIKATAVEKKELSKVLGVSNLKLQNWQTQFESHGGDVIGGEILPNISVTAKGVSPMTTIGNIINVELARIRGQLRRVPTDSLKL